MIIRLTIFGVEVICLTFGNFIFDEAEAEEESDSDCSLIGGGANHNFERDPDPLSPDDRYDWGGWDFGFRRPKRVTDKDQDAPD